ncbi:MAG: hypothetical protein HFE61_10880 [Anaerotignum sp.]|nr:hypothetical protein [Anaerotignum sp.]
MTHLDTKDDCFRKTQFLRQTGQGALSEGKNPQDSGFTGGILRNGRYEYF